jgi:hypothetical protein
VTEQVEERIIGSTHGKAVVEAVVLHFLRMQTGHSMKMAHVFMETLAGTLREVVMGGTFQAEVPTEA